MGGQADGVGNGSSEAEARIVSLVFGEVQHAMNDLDQVARDTANKALASIEKHEGICAERQGHIIDSLKDLKEGVRGLHTRFWAAAIGVIMALISVCGSLVYMILHP